MLLIVNYHYFRQEKYGRGIYPISEQEFGAQIEEIQKKYEIIHPDQLLEHVDSKRRLNSNKNYCLLTFDDGLKEQMNAFDFLKTKGLGAFFFASSLPYLESKTIDVHKIHNLRRIINDESFYTLLDKKFELGQYQFDDDLLAKQYRYDDNTPRRIKYFLNFILNEKARKHFIDELFASEFGDERDFNNTFYMSKKDLLKIDSEGMLGTHAHSHQPLGMMSKDMAIEDIQKSLSYFKSIGASGVNVVSFPYGGPTAMRNDLNEFYVESGVKYVLSMERKLNPISEITQRSTLGRFDMNDIYLGKNYEKFSGVL